MTFREVKDAAKSGVELLLFRSYRDPGSGSFLLVEARRGFVHYPSKLKYMDPTERLDFVFAEHENGMPKSYVRMADLPTNDEDVFDNTCGCQASGTIKYQIRPVKELVV